MRPMWLTEHVPVASGALRSVWNPPLQLYVQASDKEFEMQKKLQGFYGFFFGMHF